MIDHGQTRQIESLSEEAREAYNAAYDAKSDRQPGHELGVPGFARLRAELSEQELHERIWSWHTRNERT